MSNTSHLCAPTTFFHFTQQVDKSFPLARTDCNRFITPTERSNLFAGDQVDLVENQQPGDFVKVKILEDAINSSDLLFEARIGNIDHMQKQVCVNQFFQGCLERTQQTFR